MRRIATLTAAVFIGGGMAALGGGAAAQAAHPAVHPPRIHCATTMPVVPRQLPRAVPYRPLPQRCPGWHIQRGAWTIRL